MLWWDIDCEHERRCFLYENWSDDCYITAENCIQAWNTRCTESLSEIACNAPNSGENDLGE